jgi:hypothetical protein
MKRSPNHKQNRKAYIKLRGNTSNTGVQGLTFLIIKKSKN